MIAWRTVVQGTGYAVSYCSRRLGHGSPLLPLLLACISLYSLSPCEECSRVRLNSDSTLRPARVIDEAEGSLPGHLLQYVYAHHGAGSTALCVSAANDVHACTSSRGSSFHFA